jgi:hypothetical protein
VNVCADFEVQLIEMDGEDDQMHLLLEYPPKVAVSNRVNSLKAVSSRLLRKERPDIQSTTGKVYCGRRPTSPHPAVALRSPSCGRTSSSSKRHAEIQGRLRRLRYPSPP